MTHFVMLHLVMVMVIVMGHLLLIHFVCWHTHHFQHGGSARAEKPDYQYSSDNQEDNIEHGGIVPLHAFADCGHVAVLWDNPQRGKQELDHIAGSSHCHIECHENVTHDLPSVVFAVDVQDRQNDQICKDEADHTAKANSTAPQHGGQRHIAH